MLPHACSTTNAGAIFLSHSSLFLLVGERPSTRQQPINNSSVTQKQRQGSPPNQYRYSAPSEVLAPVRPPATLKRSHYSTPSALNMIRDDLSNKLPNQSNGAGVMQAWHSNPSSRNSSRNPSRQGSRQTSGRMPRTTSNGTFHARTASNDTSEISTGDELVFHDVRSNTLPRSKKATFSISDSSESINSTVSHLPSITETPPVPAWKRKRSESSPEKRNGFTHSEAVEIGTLLSVDEVLAEILRAGLSLKIREVEKSGASRVTCTWGGVKFLVLVSKERFDTCKLTFQWLSGGDAVSYREKCDRLSRKLKL